jgi:hypothetical protein
MLVGGERNHDDFDHAAWAEQAWHTDDDTVDPELACQHD